MVIQLFNSSSVSGPEALVLPSLSLIPRKSLIVNLEEERLQGSGESPLVAYCASLGLSYQAIRVRSRLDNEAIRSLRQLLATEKPKIVHAHDVKAAYCLLMAQRGLQNRPILFSTHHGVLGRPDFKTRSYEWLYRFFFLRFFDRILAVSSEDYRTLAKAGYNAKRLRLHLNGSTRPLVKPEVREEQGRQARERWGIQGSELILGCVGRLSAEKDHERLLSVLSHLKSKQPKDWKCLVFGNGPLRQRLEKRAKELGLEERVLWMGYRAQVREEFAGFDLLLSFSKAEGLPINLIEAGWAGTPVFATAVGGVLDLIPSEKFGELVPPHESAVKTAERLAHFLSAKADLRQRALAFQSRVQAEFSGERWARELDAMYKESIETLARG